MKSEYEIYSLVACTENVAEPEIRMKYMVRMSQINSHFTSNLPKEGICNIPTTLSLWYCSLSISLIKPYANNLSESNVWENEARDPKYLCRSFNVQDHFTTQY